MIPCAGVVDEIVDAAPTIRHRFEHAISSSGVGHVAGNSEALVSAQSGGRRLCRGAITIENGDARASRCKELRRRRTDACACSGDENTAVRK